jgi:biopolymer transport protein ExbB/TolQ
MKKFGIAFLALLLISVVSFAQQRNFEPEEVAKRQTAQLKEELELNADQEKKVYEINLESMKKMGEMREKMRGGGNFEGMREKMAEAREEQNKKMKKILNDDQWTKYEKYLEERRSQMRDRRRQ